MLTVGSFTIRATREQAAFVAACANLAHEISSHPTDKGEFASWNGGGFDLWQDSQLSGGACRIVWRKGIAWISRHSGYAYADITEEVAELFAELGCKPVDGYHHNPLFIGR